MCSEDFIYYINRDFKTCPYLNSQAYFAGFTSILYSVKGQVEYKHFIECSGRLGCRDSNILVFLFLASDFEDNAFSLTTDDLSFNHKATRFGMINELPNGIKAN